MAGLELLIMPMVTMGGAFLFGVSQVRSASKSRKD